MLIVKCHFEWCQKKNQNGRTFITWATWLGNCMFEVMWYSIWEEGHVHFCSELTILPNASNSLYYDAQQGLDWLYYLMNYQIPCSIVQYGKLLSDKDCIIETVLLSGMSFLKI